MLKNKVIFVDFDNTLTKHSEPPITGELNMLMVNYFKILAKNNILILYTCRTGEELNEAKKLCDSVELKFHGYNEYNGQKFIKPRYDLLIDDKTKNTSILYKIEYLLKKITYEIKNWIKECIETFNEVEKFRIEHNLSSSVDCNFYGFSEVK